MICNDICNDIYRKLQLPCLEILVGSEDPEAQVSQVFTSILQLPTSCFASDGLLPLRALLAGHEAMLRTNSQRCLQPSYHELPWVAMSCHELPNEILTDFIQDDPRSKPHVTYVTDSCIQQMMLFHVIPIYSITICSMLYQDASKFSRYRQIPANEKSERHGKPSRATIQLP